MLGLFIDEISHDLWLNEVNCHLNYHTAGGIQTSPVKGKIVAKKTFDWDMEAPMGKRESNMQQTSNFKPLLLQLIQAKQLT